MERPTISFFSLPPGALACFKETSDFTSLDPATNLWVKPPSYMSDSLFVYMGVISDIGVYAPRSDASVSNEEKIKNMRQAIKKCLQDDHKRIVKSVDGGYLAVCYYRNWEDSPLSPHDNVGYIHSSTPVQYYTLHWSITNDPPSWFHLKAFC